MQAALGGQFAVVKVAAGNAAAGGDVVFHQAQPAGLLGAEGGRGLGVVAKDPGLKLQVDLISKGRQFTRVSTLALQADGKAHQRQNVGELAFGTHALDLAAFDAGVGAPELFSGQHQRRAAQALVQVFDHVEGERAALAARGAGVGTWESDVEASTGWWDAQMFRLRGIDREGVERGQVLCKPKSVMPHTKFEAEAYILTKEEGGRHTPFFANYRPQFYFRTTDVTGTVELPAGTEMVMPGDNLKFNVELIAPIAMEEKLRFAIREGGRTVGAGVVSKIIA